jgi:hypothetical protein
MKIKNGNLMHRGKRWKMSTFMSIETVVLLLLGVINEIDANESLVCEAINKAT